MEDLQNKEAIEEIITKIASEYIDMPEDKVLAELTEAGFAQEDIDDIMTTISEVKAAELGGSEPEQMANEDDTPVKVTETVTDVDSDGDADKKEVKAEKTKPDDDTVENKAKKSDTEHSKAEDKPNDSDSDSSLEFTPDEVKSALSNAANSTHVGGIASAINSLSGPGKW